MHLPKPLHVPTGRFIPTPRRRMALLAAVLLSTTAIASSHAETTKEITKNGITWTFKEAAPFGRFVNGDFWVVGPVTVTAVSPEWDDVRHGSMLDPVPSKGRQGYRKNIKYPFGDDDRVRFPITISGTKSLVSTVGLDEILTGGSATGVDKAAVLTVLESAPPPGTFRPPYAGGEKPLFNKKDVAYQRVPLLPLPAGTTVPILANSFTEVWLQGGFSGDVGASIIPNGNVPAYSRDAALQLSDLSLAMMVDTPEREDYINRMIQLGIDLYYLHLDNGDAWRAIGGFGNGRKWPILFAGILLDHVGMQKPVYTVPGKYSRTGTIHKFGEDGHTFYGKPSDAYPQGRPLFGQDAPKGVYEAYIETGKGPRDARDPEGLKQGEGYRICCTSRTWPGYALAARLMKAVPLWGHDAFFDYVDWWCEVEEKENHENFQTFPSRFVESMWKTYRHSEQAASIIPSNTKKVSQAGELHSK